MAATTRRLQWRPIQRLPKISEVRKNSPSFFLVFLVSTKKCLSIDEMYLVAYSLCRIDGQDMNPLVVSNRWTGHRSWAMQLTKWRSWIKSSCRHEEIIGHIITRKRGIEAKILYLLICILLPETCCTKPRDWIDTIKSRFLCVMASAVFF